MTKPTLSQEYLKRLLSYNEMTGEFTWLLDHARNKAGDIVPSSGKDYVRIGIDGVGYSAHRLAFIYMLGYAPDLIDHRNRVRSDNRWANLRPSNVSNNTRNSVARSTNITGIRGISLNKVSNKYEVRIKPVYGKIIFKSFSELNDAIEFKTAKELEIFGDL